MRRLVARASVFDNQEKCAIVRRAIVGALGAGANVFAYVPDSHGIAESALAEFGSEVCARAVESPRTASALDTIRGARALAAAGCAAVLTLGGDGTNRAFALGWRDAPLLPISTGTNNVFPRFVEATVAGAAAGLIASGAVALRDVARAAKTIRVQIDGERDDLALIDAVLTTERFVGARALLEADLLRLALLTRADPAAVGITAIGGLIAPLSDAADQGLLLMLGSGNAGGARADRAGPLRERSRIGLASGRVRRGNNGDRSRRAGVRRRARTGAEAGPARALDRATRRSMGDRCGEDACPGRGCRRIQNSSWRPGWRLRSIW